VNLQAKKIKIFGRVQGVGFRPFVYRLAKEANLNGYVGNDDVGVDIYIEGKPKDIASFLVSVQQNLPPLATIDNISINDIKPLCEKEFKIIEKAKNRALKTATVSPDFAICKNCKEDILSQNNKYSNYFATNCTDCGPRYSIVKTVPYDRKNTSMSKFKMCSSCQHEYDDPLDRRYHAQPISCPQCGPRLNGKIKNTAQYIKDGKIVAIKGIGGFHLVCDASNTDSVLRLRDYKNRPTKPFAVMCKDLKQLKSLAKPSLAEEKILTSKEAPIVILKKNPHANISEFVAPKINKIGCFLPYAPLQILLFGYLDNPIIATSANLGDEPIITDIKEIKAKLPFVEHVLDFDRDIVNAIDDSLVNVIDGKLQVLRLARGYAPKSIKLPCKIDKKILAVGANQKNTIALAFGENMIVSPYIGDLNSIKSFDFFTRTLESFKRFYDFEPDVIVHDKHPGYETTKWAKAQNKELFEVQHHLSHIYATKAEFGLNGKYVGFAFDGTGYGDDGTLWGGEVFVGDKRKYHFKPIKLLGGEKAIKEPRRIALSMLFQRYAMEEIFDFDLSFEKHEIKLLYQSYTKNINSPLSTSVGRLFDGVASLAGLCDFQTYEGEAGLLCEMAYNPTCQDSFSFYINDGEIAIEFDFFDADLVSKFINTLVEIVLFVAKKESLDVILSGGVFQNKTLLELLIKRLKSENIGFYHQQNTPINDSGISIGQIWKYITS